MTNFVLTVHELLILRYFYRYVIAGLCVYQFFLFDVLVLSRWLSVLKVKQFRMHCFFSLLAPLLVLFQCVKIVDLCCAWKVVFIIVVESMRCMCEGNARLDPSL